MGGEDPGLGVEQAKLYERDGYLFPISVFTSGEATAVGEEVLGVAAAGLSAHPAPWTQKAYLLMPSLDALIRDSRLTDAVAGIVGDDILALSADLFIKPAGSKGHITWHQDVNYWQLEPLDVLTAWIALTPATVANGCMRYFAGGHRNRLHHVERPNTDNMLTRGQEIAVAIDENAATPVELEPGQVSFHHALAPHASGPNTTDAPRIGFAVRFAPTSVKQLAGPPISARLVRGSDRYGHFALENGPDAALSPLALAEHRRALAAHEHTGFSTV